VKAFFIFGAMQTLENSKGIRTWSEDDRPREKLMEKGCTVLSDAELLAILLGSGSRDLSAVSLAREILASVSNNLVELGKLGRSDLSRFRGMGDAKSASVMAAMELGRRRRSVEARQYPKLTSSREAYEYFLQNMGDLPHEEFWAMYLNRANRIVSLRKMSEGGMSSTVADPKKIYSKALDDKAAAVIVAHNHPSGNLSPSTEDKKLTVKLRKAGHVLECPLLDHLIITDRGYYSFADEGMLDTE